MSRNQIILIFIICELIYLSQITSFALPLSIILTLFIFQLKSSNPKLSFIILSALIIGSQDITSDGVNEIQSFYSISIVFTMPMIVLLLYFLPTIFKDIFFKKLNLNYGGGILKWYFFLGMLGTFSSFFSNISLRQFISDLSLLAIPFMVIYFLDKKKLNKNFVMYTLMFTALFKILTDAQNYFTGYGVSLGLETSYFFDSVGNLGPAIAIFGLFLITEKKLYFLGLLSSFLGVYSTVNRSSRGTILLGAVSILLYCFFYFKLNKINLFSYDTFRFILVLSFFGIVFLFGVGDFFWWKVSTFIPSENFSVLDPGVTSSTVRLMELINIYHYLINNGLILNGVGFGGYFQDTFFPFTHYLFDTSSYPDEWIINNTIYKPHLVVLYIFLKTGLIGLIIWLIIFYKVSIGKILILKKMKNTSTIMLTGLASSISILIYFKSFNSKLQFITGLLLYVICSSKNIDHEF